MAPGSSFSWATDSDASFKHYFLESIGASPKPPKDSQVIVAIAEAWDGQAELPAPLRRTLAALKAWSDSLGEGDRWALEGQGSGRFGFQVLRI